MDNETRAMAGIYQATTQDRRCCPESGSLARLAAGQAWPWQRRRLAAHLAGCAHCADEYRTLLAARDGLRDALGLTPGGATAGDRLPRLVPAGVAAVAVAALSAALVFNTDPENRPHPAPAADTIFASNFDPKPAPVDPEGAGRRDPSGDVLFRSDFDETSGS